MTEVGLFEAKTHLSKLVERVERGEEITLTRHGRAVAKLVPAPDARAALVDDLMRRFAELRKKQRLDGITIRELIDEGRRYL